MNYIVLSLKLQFHFLRHVVDTPTPLNASVLYSTLKPLLDQEQRILGQCTRQIAAKILGHFGQMQSIGH